MPPSNEIPNIPSRQTNDASSTPPYSKKGPIVAIGVAAILLLIGAVAFVFTRNTTVTIPQPVQPATSTQMSMAVTASYIKQHGLLVFNDPQTPGNSQGGLVPQLSIFTQHADGSEKKTLTGPGNAFPSWTPDGRIIFVSDRSGAPQIWTMDADGGNPHQVGDIKMNEHVYKPQLGKNGIIAFSVDDGVWVMRQDGSELRLLVPNAGAPSLALSGTWLTYTQPGDPTKNGHNEIFRINTDGTDKVQLTFPTDPDYPDANASAISPDETMVAIYTGVEDNPAHPYPWEWGHRNIAVMSAQGGARKLLTTCQPVSSKEQLMGLSHTACITSDNPSWSPNGQWILYDRGGLYGNDEWMVDDSGQNAQQLNGASLGAGVIRMKFDSSGS